MSNRAKLEHITREIEQRRDLIDRYEEQGDINGVRNARRDIEALIEKRRDIMRQLEEA